MILDDAYAVGAHIPGSEAFPPRWAAEAAAFRAAVCDHARLNQSYGPDPRNRFDLFLPQHDPIGTVVFVHGGYWKGFDRSDWSHLAAGPLGQGWAVAMPSYTLAPAARIGDITREVAQAIETIAEATKGPVALTGHSAGGHLVARMLQKGLLPKATAKRLCHVLPISPLGDLRPLLQTTMNETLRLDEAEALAESPMLIEERLPVPTTIWVGADERPVFVDQARALSVTWGVPLTIVPRRHHFDVIDALGDPDSAMVGTLLGGTLD